MQGDKTNFYVSLYGYNDELKQLDEFLDSPKCHLEQLKETNERYFLTACRFSNLTEDSEIIESAKKLVTIIKAFAKIELERDFQSINIGHGKIIIDNKDVTIIIKRVAGRQDVSIALPTLGATASVISAAVTMASAESSTPSKHKKNIHDDYLNRCDEEIDGNIFDALYYFAEETSFYSLYKVYEIIKSVTDKNPDVNKYSKMIRCRWVKNVDEVLAFKRSANCYGAVKNPEGKYSRRHSEEWCLEQVRLKRAKEYKGDILELPETEDFIRRLLKNWIASKCPKVSK